MPFFRTPFSLFSLSLFIMGFGEAMIDIFVPIYFWKMGLLLPQILLFFLFVSLSFVLLSYPTAKLVVKIREGHAILLSVPFLLAYYGGLSLFPSHPSLFWILPIILAIRLALYNYSYHLTFLHHSKEKRRGKELAWIGSVTLLAGTIAPLIGGKIASLNFSFLFSFSAICILLGTLPLFFFENGKTTLQFSFHDLWRYIFSKKELRKTISFAGYAIETSIGRTLWPIYLFTIAKTVQATGAIVSISLLFSLAAFTIIGKLTDHNKRGTLLFISTILYVFGWIGRLFVTTPLQIITVDTYKNTMEKMVLTPWSATSYDLAKKDDPFLFIVSREIIFNAVRVLFLPLLILIFLTTTSPFQISFLIASFCSFSYLLLRK